MDFGTPSPLLSHPPIASAGAATGGAPTTSERKLDIWWKTLVVGVIVGLIVAGSIMWLYKKQTHKAQVGAADDDNDGYNDHLTYAKQMRRLAKERAACLAPGSSSEP